MVFVVYDARMCCSAGTHWNIVSREGHSTGEELQRRVLHALGEDHTTHDQSETDVATEERCRCFLQYALFRIVSASNTHASTSTHVHTHVHTCTHTHVQHTCTHMNTRAHTCMHTHMCTPMHNIHTHMHTHANMHTHTYAQHPHTHAHTHTCGTQMLCCTTRRL